MSPENYHELFPESANASKLLTSQAKERKLASELSKLKEQNKKEEETLKTTRDLVERLLKQKDELEREKFGLKVKTLMLMQSYKTVWLRDNWMRSRLKRMPRLRA